MGKKKTVVLIGMGWVTSEVASGRTALTLCLETLARCWTRSGKWQGRLDLNQRMAGSKPAALPLGDAPVSTAFTAHRSLVRSLIASGIERMVTVVANLVFGPLQQCAEIYQHLFHMGSTN